jgi:hypothetical protein
MSARASSEAFVAMLAAPVLALVNQGLMYSVNMWACGHGARSVMHIVPIICLCLSLGSTVVAYRSWVAVDRGTEDELATVDSRTRFLAILGIAIGVFSSAVILAQWASVFVFDPCARA